MALGYTRTQASWADGAGGNTPVDAVDLENYDRQHLIDNNTRISLFWNGSTYALPKYTPTGAAPLADTSRPREFVGPVDPSTITGVVLAPYDTWVPVS